LISSVLFCLETLADQSKLQFEVAAQDAGLVDWPDSLARDPKILFEAVSEGNIMVLEWLLNRAPTRMPAIRPEARL
jgi:hypothetical protein